MALLKEATNQTAYIKAGFQGFAGSGKTRTASDFALGLAKTLGNGKPVAFIDTETGSDYMIPRFREAGVKLLTAKTRAFSDLLTFMREAEDGCSVALIDSITHFWSELLRAYQTKFKRRKLEFQDWGPIKQEWQQFTDAYLNSQLHVIMCGRAGYEYETERNEETGKREIVKSGTKMKTEGETAFEPSLLIEMVRVSRAEVTGDASAKGWIHRAIVLKDRTDRMNGAQIDNPTFESFRPIVDFLNLGGVHVGVDTSRNSESLFDDPDRSRYENTKRKEIALERLKEALIQGGLDGNSNDAKTRRVDVLIKVFGTSSWAEIQALRLTALQGGVRKLRDALSLAPLILPWEHNAPESSRLDDILDIPSVPGPESAAA